MARRKCDTRHIYFENFRRKLGSTLNKLGGESMKEAKKQTIWTGFLNFYTEQNKGRLTRLAVFENGNDYWLEDGLPLTGISIDSAKGDKLTVQIMLGENFTHVAESALRMKAIFSFEPNEEGLDIEDLDGKTTYLRFEN
jgi:hypothetical protein